MEDFVVTCPLVPDVPHLISGFCSSPRIFGLGFLQTPPRGDALALLLTFDSANIWFRDFHPISYGPCPAHTPCSLAGRTGHGVRDATIVHAKHGVKNHARLCPSTSSKR